MSTSLGRSAATLEAAAAKLGERTVAVVSDIATQADLDALKALVEQQDERLDAVFANAGICEKTGWRYHQGCVLHDVRHQRQRCVLHGSDAPALDERRRGDRADGLHLLQQLSFYNASKAAVRSFIRTWANELKGRKIRTNVLSPGFTRTRLMDNGLKMDEAQIEALRQHVAQIVPLGYMADPSEIASAALLLASADAQYVNGVELMVDGGLSQI
ncbi:SDR family oxidoreductase [Pseudomonas karstica]